MAMVLHEALSRHPRACAVQIFATDVYQASLDIAQAGFYAPESLSHLSPERLARYFMAEAQGYRVIPALRQMVVFARHDVTRDAPFTKLDIVACRNLLIYLEPMCQQRVLRRLHYGLKLDGVLMLGRSESVEACSNGFTELHRHWKMYRKTLPSQSFLDMPTLPLGRLDARDIKPVVQAVLPRRQDLEARQALYNTLLDTVVPAGILARLNGEVEHYMGAITPFLAPLHGPKSDQVLDIVHPALQSGLRVAMIRALRDQQRVSDRHIRLAHDDGIMQVTLHVTPLMAEPEMPLALFVSFEKEAGDDAARVLEMEEDADALYRLRVLEQELHRSQASLQTAVEALQASNEELRTTNAELVVANEELQSSNEELQSLNEELYTINAEYQYKNNRLADLNTDMENLLQSTEIGTIFLDRNRYIRKYTPAITDVIPLQPQDIGRPIGHFATDALGKLETQLTDLLAEVVKTRTPVSYEVRSVSGRGYLLRVHPFMNAAQEVAGTVVTLVDTTNLEKSEGRLARA